MIKQIYIQTHKVWLNIYADKSGWYLSKTKENGNTTALSPIEAGLSNANGGHPWLIELVNTIHDNWDDYPDGFSAGYFGDLKD
ncbi:hypothetical protein VOWphi5012_042 [Vibrio phage phi50-12]|uniref:Uncharacterized protein n=1 Tax=Vibrio phage phi50-12 TaxID=2654972 RepID=A0A5P8PRD7_9CAUD|nr:hypothetical protein KNU82_gp042 [Vibrio phage phi50-12]QFR59826.1 hypothetical protein VOWphi5012_042 [Vibrio phage phi50-12]